MDIAELAIRVSVVADDVGTVLQQAQQEVQEFGKKMQAATGKKIDIKIGTGQITSATQSTESLGKAIDDVNSKKIDITALQDQSNKANADFLADVARRQEMIAERSKATIQAVAKEVASGNQAVAESTAAAVEGVGEAGQASADAWAPVAQAAGGTAESFSEIAPAAADAGTAAQVAGAQAAAGSVAATAGTTAWAAATERLKLVLGGVAGMAAAMITRQVISFITGWIGKLVSAREEAEKLRLETAKLNKESADEGQGRVEKLDAMIRRYEELSRKQILTAAEDRELASLQEQLADSYDLRARGLDSVVKSNERYLEIAKELRQEELEQLAVSQKKVSQDAYVAAFNTNVTDALGKREAALKRVADKQAVLDRLEAANLGADISGYGQAALEKAQRELADAEANAKFVVSATKGVLEENSGLFADWYNAAMAEAKTAVQASGGEWSDQIEAALRPLVEFDLSRFNTEEEAKAFVDSIIGSIGVAMNDADLSEAMGGLGGLVNQIFAGDISSEEAVAQMTEQLNLLQQVAYEAFVKMGMSCEEANGKAIALRNSLTGGLGAQEFAADVAKAGMEAVIAASGLDKMDKSADDLTKTMKELGAKSLHLDNWDKFVNTLKTAKKGSDEFKAGIAGAQKEAATFGLTLNDDLSNLDEVTDAMGRMRKATDDDMTAMVNQAIDLQDQLGLLEASAHIMGEMGLDNSAFLAAIAIVQKKMDDLISDAAAKGIDLAALMKLAGSGGGGKGGGSKKSTPSASTSTSSGPTAYEKAMEQLRHLKALGQVTYEQELAYLENIQKKYKLSADERRSLEEDIYAVKKQIWERDAAEVDKMGQGIKDALAARYEAMQETELVRLDESRKAWEQWRDDSVKAINDQIAALEKLAQTEDREKKDAEELRKIAKLRQDVEFEQDDYNRMKLQQQLDQAIAAREERLRKQALDDQKAALREEITAIQEKANQQISALDEEQSAIEQAYAERLKGAALQAEAERMIMANNQDEIIALLGEYAPEYDALGKTLGEKLLDGFQKKVGSVIDWFKSLNDTLYNIQQNAASQAIAAADAFSSAYAQRQAAETSVPTTTIVEQTVNFNQPVETATQAARRLEQANQELGELLALG